MVTVILLLFFAVLAVILGFAFWGGNANRKAGRHPDGNRENPLPPHTH